MPWSNWEKYGSWNSRCGFDMHHDADHADRPDASVRAAAFGRKLSGSHVEHARRVSSATVPPFRTRDTVARETPPERREVVESPGRALLARLPAGFLRDQRPPSCGASGSALRLCAGWYACQGSVRPSVTPMREYSCNESASHGQTEATTHRAEEAP